METQAGNSNTGSDDDERPVRPRSNFHRKIANNPDSEYRLNSGIILHATDVTAVHIQLRGSAFVALR